MPRGRKKKPLKERKIRLWYVLSVELGSDTKVQKEVKRQAILQGLDKQIGRVMRPRCPQEDEKGIVKRRMMFPGYLLIKCKYSEHVFHLINSVQGANGLLMNPLDPVPLETAEAAIIMIRNQERMKEEYKKSPVQAPPVPVSCKWKPNDKVIVTEGTWEGFEGIVTVVNPPRIVVSVEVMGRPTLVPVTAEQLKER